MHEIDGDRAFAYRRCNAFHIARTNISNGKHSWQACFKHVWRTFEWPRPVLVDRVQVAASEDETLIVKGYTTPKPIGTWRSARHNKHVANTLSRRVETVFFPPRDPFPMGIAFEANELHFVMHFDSRVLFDALD